MVLPDFLSLLFSVALCRASAAHLTHIFVSCSPGSAGRGICQALSKLAARSCTSHCCMACQASLYSQAVRDLNHRSFALWVYLIHHLINCCQVQISKNIKYSFTWTDCKLKKAEVFLDFFFFNTITYTASLSGWYPFSDTYHPFRE